MRIEAEGVSLTDESIVMELLEGCARCGGTHRQLRFFKLERPQRVAGAQAVFSHWALCPQRREPIMMDSDLLEERRTWRS